MQELKPERCYMSFSFLVANTLFERDENRTNLFNPNSPTQFFFGNLKRTSHNVAIRCRVSWAHTLPPWTASHGSGADSLGVRVTWCACERLWSSWTTWPKFLLPCWRQNPPCYVPQRPKVLDYWHLDPTKSFGTFQQPENFQLCGSNKWGEMLIFPSWNVCRSLQILIFRGCVRADCPNPNKVASTDFRVFAMPQPMIISQN